MCGFFIICPNNGSLLKEVPQHDVAIVDTLKHRGPDRQTTVRGDSFIATHALLSINSSFEQPIITDDFCLVWNGEIYNDYDNYREDYGDSQYLTERLHELREHSFEGLDGEFAIACYQQKKQKLVMVTDPFGTKPLYFLQGNGWCAAASYPSSLMAAGLPGTPIQIAANTKIEVDTRTGNLLTKQYPLWQFDFNNATGNDYDNWCESFTDAITKRVSNLRHGLFVSLSSGYDSGLIAAELLHLGIPFSAYIAPYQENPQVLNARQYFLRQNDISVTEFQPDPNLLQDMSTKLCTRIEPYQVVNREDPFANYQNPDLHSIPGYIVSALIHQYARDNNNLISLSGQGADEIISDYYLPPHNPAKSNLRGDWTRATSPWINFDKGWNRAFLGASERIAGAFGIETRYPFLDTEVVQQFLYLSPRTKSAVYKAPIAHRLRQLNFPNFWNYKQGFAGAKMNENQSSPVI